MLFAALIYIGELARWTGWGNQTVRDNHPMQWTLNTFVV
jgi:hypothetical protein